MYFIRLHHTYVQLGGIQLLKNVPHDPTLSDSERLDKGHFTSSKVSTKDTYIFLY